MTTLEVYWGSGSQPAWRVLLTLVIKGVPYESKLMSFSSGELKAPEFIAMNPRHKVPTIRDGDYTLYESMAILAYLEKKYPDPPLFGSTPEETGLIWRWISEFQAYLEPTLHGEIVRPLFFNKSEERADSIRAAIEPLHTELANWEAQLGRTPYLVGAELTAADVVFFPTFMGLLRAAGKPAAQAFDLNVLPLEERYPNLQQWVKRFEALPGYDAIYPPHWKE
jgi:glutathione S-transferase